MKSTMIAGEITQTQYPKLMYFSEYPNIDNQKVNPLDSYIVLFSTRTNGVLVYISENYDGVYNIGDTESTYLPAAFTDFNGEIVLSNN